MHKENNDLLSIVREINAKLDRLIDSLADEDETEPFITLDGEKIDIPDTESESLDG